jgi:hypothetical protein
MTQTFELVVNFTALKNMSDDRNTVVETRTLNAKTFDKLVYDLRRAYTKFAETNRAPGFRVVRYCSDRDNQQGFAMRDVTGDVKNGDVNVEMLTGVDMLFHSLMPL